MKIKEHLLVCVNALVRYFRKNTCKHEFDLADLNKTNIPPLEQPASKSDYCGWVEYFKNVYNHDSVTKRVMWPCWKCGKIFFAHCGLDIIPTHGKCVRRELDT